MSMPLTPAQGGSVSQEFFEILIGQKKDGLLDLTMVSPAWNSTCWAFGFDELYASIAMTPNSSAMARVLWLGEIETIAFELT